MVLTSCRGEHRDVLMERLRFSTGEGFPGIVASTGKPVSTRRLADEATFLRPTLTRCGVKSFLSVPLGSRAAGTQGCVSLAWRSGNPPLDAACELIRCISPPIVATIGAALLAARVKVERAVCDAGPDPEARAAACLAVLVESAGASHGTMVIYGPGGRESSFCTTNGSADACSDALDGRVRCRLVQSGHGVVLASPRAEWPTECRCLPQGMVSPLCLPLRSDRRLVGVAILERPQPPAPPGRDLVPLLTMAAEAAVRLDPMPAVGKQKSASVARVERMLEIRCLGGFEVNLFGHPVPLARFARRKALTLLKYLVLRPGVPVSRDALVERLWPGVDSESGANRLHGVVHALRTVIEPRRDQTRWLFLCNSGDVYYFNAESPHWIDLHQFKRAVTAGEDAARHGRREEAIARFEWALDLYRGDLFADDPYAEWCEVDRTGMRNAYVGAISRLADLWFAEGSMERGIAWLHRGLVADPLREDVHQRIIRALIRSGRREEALEQYRVCSRLLHDELGASPLAETRRLERLAMSGREPVSLPIVS